MDETDSPASTVTSSDVASSAMHSGSEQRRQSLQSGPGSMSLGGPGGHSRYIGITTNYHIYSNMYHAEKEETRRERERNAARARDVLANIPFAAHSHLIDKFWSCYNTIIHIVHRRAFELDSGMLVGGDSGGIDNRSANLVGNNSPASGSGSSGSGSSGSGSNNSSRRSGYYYSPFLHMCILAIGYRYADRSRADVQAFATPDGESLLHDEAKRQVDSELQMPGGVPSLQALLLLGDLECGVGRYNTGWLYAGMACRLVFDLGLNRQISPAGQSRLDMEVRRTVLWGCVLLDRFWGLFLGRPTSIKIADISIPASMSTFIPGTGMTTQLRRLQGCLPMGPQCRFETQIYEALISLTDTACKLTDAAHRHYTTADPSAYYFVTGLHRELRSWYKQLPRRLQWTPANLARNPPSAFFNLHQQYHTLYILMYRPFLSAGKATPAGTHNTGGGQTNGNSEPAPFRSRDSPYDDMYGDDHDPSDVANEDDDRNGEADNCGGVNDDETETEHDNNDVNNDDDDNDDDDDDMDPELDCDIVMDMARKVCFAHAIEVARIYEAFCARFECRSMFVTGMQHAATAAFAIVDGLATQRSAGKQAETLLHLQRLAEALYAHASVYYPARVMSSTLFRVLGEYRDSHAQQQQHHQQQQQQQQQQQPSSSYSTSAAPTWTTASVPASLGPGMIQSAPMPAISGTTPSGNTDWAGVMSGGDNDRGVNGMLLHGTDTSGFADFDFDLGIWDTIMNTLSQPLNSMA